MNLAQVTTEWLAPITQFGVAGSMLYWLTARVEVRMKAMEAAVDRMAKAAVLQILAYKLSSPAGSSIQEQATALLSEIDNKNQGNR